MGWILNLRMTIAHLVDRVWQCCLAGQRTIVQSRIVVLGLSLMLMLSLVLGTGFGSVAQAAPVEDTNLEAQVLKIIRRNPGVVIEAINLYQRQQEQRLQQQQQSFLQQMRAQPQSVIGPSPTLGSSDQKFVLLLFSDFQCPYCGRVRDTVKQFLANHPEVTLVYKNLPISQIHPQAYPAAMAAWAAYQQGKFWEYYDALFDRQLDIGPNLYGELADQLDLDRAKFDRDRNSNTARQAIERDLDMADALAIRGTPFFALNGEALPGAVDLEQFELAFARVTQ